MTKFIFIMRYNLLRFLGMFHTQKGQFETALGDFKKALEISKKSHQEQEEAQALINIGRVYGQLGYYEESIDSQHQSLDILEKLIESTSSEKTQNKLKEIKGKALGNLGIAYAGQENYDCALQSLQEAYHIFENTNQMAKAMISHSLGNIKTIQGNYEEAKQYLKISLEIAQEAKNKVLEGRVLGSLGTTYAFLEEYDQAIKYWQKDLEIFNKSQQIQEKNLALANLGFILISQGKFIEAEKRLYEAIKIRESLRIDLSDLNKVSLFETQLDAYQSLQQALVRQNKFEEALEIAERGRARAFVELLIENLASSNLKPSLIQGLLSKIGAAAETKSPSLKEIKEIAHKYQITLVEYSIIKDYLKDESGKYFYKEAELYIWVINPQGDINFQFVDLKRLWQENQPSLSELVSELNHKLFLPFENEQLHTRNILQKLYQYLIQPIADCLPNTLNDLVVFIPQGNLFMLPFPALLDGNDQFLIEKQTLLISPSIQVLDIITQHYQPTELASLNALVVGNPIMPKLPPDSEAKDKKLEALPSSGVEALAIADLLNTKALIREAATKQEVTIRMEQAGLIHLASHGLLEELKQPDIQGAIALAPSESDDGFLLAIEILRMKLKAQLVVLSASNSGGGKITADDVIGLSRCFLAAGVPRLIISLIGADDFSTFLLMVKFYEILQPSLPSIGLGDTAKALNQAQRWLLTLTKEEAIQELEKRKSYLDQSFIAQEKDEQKALKKVQRRINGINNKRQTDPFAEPKYWSIFLTIGL